MNPITAYTHRDGTMTITITETSQIDWLRSMGVSNKFLSLGTHHLPSVERSRLYPTLSEAIEPALSRYLAAVRNISE
jgi:hypothetical protein